MMEDEEMRRERERETLIEMASNLREPLLFLFVERAEKASLVSTFCVSNASLCKHPNTTQSPWFVPCGLQRTSAEPDMTGFDSKRGPLRSVYSAAGKLIGVALRQARLVTL